MIIGASHGYDQFWHQHADVSSNRDEGSNFAANHWGNSQQSDV